MSVPPAWRSPGLARRFACAVYELLILTALVLIAGFPFLALTGDATAGWKRHLMQAYVLVVVGSYLVWFWTHGGQTLAMKTWRIRVESQEGGPVTREAALRRYLFALIGLAAAGIGYLWAFLDRDRQFLHDRLARTRLASADPPPKA